MLLRFGYSPCPNDTFLFYALMHGLIDTGIYDIRIEHHDIATLNQLAQSHSLELTKLSIATYATLQEHYQLLPVGAALGKGVGPLIITRPDTTSDPSRWKLALPGPQTTAHQLALQWNPHYSEVCFLPFHRILEALKEKEVDAGVIIHESRFSFEAHGLEQRVDLGRWWKETQQCPLPLGGVAIKKELANHATAISEILRRSLEYAQRHPDEPYGYMQQKAQESTRSYLENHVALYVNEYTEDLGESGWKAIELFLENHHETTMS